MLRKILAEDHITWAQVKTVLQVARKIARINAFNQLPPGLFFIIYMHGIKS